MINRLGQPVLTSKATRTSPGGCLYYAMKGRPLSDVWQFCLDRHDRVNEGATLYSETQPAPPPGASAARAVLLARGDGICTSENAKLVKPTKMDIWVANSDGTEAHQVTYLPGASFAPYFFPNGKRILFSSNFVNPRGPDFDIYAIDIDGTHRTLSPTRQGETVLQPCAR